MVGCKVEQSSSPKTYLTADEETELAQFSLQCAEIDTRIKKKKVLALVRRLNAEKRDYSTCY